MTAYADELIENIRLTPSDAVARGLRTVAIDGVSVADSNLAYYGLVTAVRFTVADQLAGIGIENLYITEAIRLVAKLYRGDILSLVDGVGLNALQIVQRGAQIIEQLGIGSTLVGGGNYQISVTQGLILAEKLALFVGAATTDGLVFEDAPTARARAIAVLNDTVGFSDQIAPYFLLNVVVDEAIDISAEMAVRMLFQPTLIDGVEISAGYLGPNGSLTTWVMNTRTGAVSEYQDYGFNSFARVDNKYLAASDTGLYELLGDDDDGTSIVARLKGGYLQFGGTQLSRLKEAYIAARGEGGWVLRILTGDGAIYNYGLTNRSMRSTKFHMGKGQRARYFAFELISAGQDFDLDTLEFVPLVVQRRV